MWPNDEAASAELSPRLQQHLDPETSIAWENTASTFKQSIFAPQELEQLVVEGSTTRISPTSRWNSQFLMSI